MLPRTAWSRRHCLLAPEPRSQKKATTTLTQGASLRRYLCSRLLSLAIRSSGCIVSFSGDDGADASARIGAVAGAAWDQMNVTMHYRLTGRHTTVDADIETRNGGVLAEKMGACFGKKSLAGTRLGRAKIEIIRRMASGDHK